MDHVDSSFPLITKLCRLYLNIVKDILITDENERKFKKKKNQKLEAQWGHEIIYMGKSDYSYIGNN